MVLRDADVLDAMAKENKPGHFCAISFWGDIPLAMGGWYPKGAGIYQVFIIPTEHIFTHQLVFCRSMIRWRNQVLEFPDCKKIITMSLPIHRVKRWMVTMGFLYEKTVENYTEGQDYDLWSITK